MTDILELIKTCSRNELFDNSDFLNAVNTYIVNYIEKEIKKAGNADDQYVWIKQNLFDEDNRFNVATIQDYFENEDMEDDEDDTLKSALNDYADWTCIYSDIEYIYDNLKTELDIEEEEEEEEKEEEEEEEHYCDVEGHENELLTFSKRLGYDCAICQAPENRCKECEQFKGDCGCNEEEEEDYNKYKNAFNDLGFTMEYILGRTINLNDDNDISEAMELVGEIHEKENTEKNFTEWIKEKTEKMKKQRTEKTAD